jgi:hypothetical protein
MKGLSTKGIHTELVQVLGSDAITYSIVTKYIHNNVMLQNERESEDRAQDQAFSITDNAILEALEMMPFVTIRQISKMIFIRPTTIFNSKH